ncbi:ABC transporter permease [Sciscionella marina]|uniref:ABC transporter permease n=1 Tax=Sciscionella marina TaxID=508770 RepID=UPI00036AFAC5|nr:ABC transporter permease subunit [Sciscionella marina]
MTVHAPNRGGMPKRLLDNQFVGGLALFIVVILAWQLCSSLTFVIPAPVRTLEVLGANLTDASYIFDLRVTAQSVFQAFLIGTLLGGLIGLGLGLSERARLWFEPLLVILNGIPKIVLYPVLLPLFGLIGAKVAMGVLFALFPVLINVATGVREMPRVYWKLASAVQANPWQKLIYVILPAIRRPLLAGLRLAVSLSVVGVVLSEFFATRRGLGRVVLQSYNHGDYPVMVATVVLLIAVAFVISILLWRWEKRLR